MANTWRGFLKGSVSSSVPLTCERWFSWSLRFDFRSLKSAGCEPGVFFTSEKWQKVEALCGWSGKPLKLFETSTTKINQRVFEIKIENRAGSWMKWHCHIRMKPKHFSLLTAGNVFLSRWKAHKRCLLYRLCCCLVPRSMSAIQHSAHYFWCIRCVSRTGAILESGIQ